MGSTSAVSGFLRHGCFTPECVAKLFAALRTRNYRILLNVFLNRRCALVLVVGSILLILVVKIVLQHIPPETEHRSARLARQKSANSGLCRRSPNGRYGIFRRPRSSRNQSGLSTGELDDLAPLLGFVGDELTEIGRRACKHRTAEISEPRPSSWGRRGRH